MVPDKLQSSTGTDWVWQSWTPTWTNLTPGNGTNNSRYTIVGKTVYFRLVFTFGNSSSMGSGPIFSLPVTAALGLFPVQVIVIGNGGCFAGAANISAITAHLATTTTAAIRLVNAAGTFAILANSITSSVPANWTTNDIIYIQGSYEMA